MIDDDALEEKWHGGAVSLAFFLFLF